ncbi:MAG: YidC/Oxa1 family membrane protein insertase [bacterium]
MLTNIMVEILEFINGIVGNYGWSIVIFTVLIRLLLYPLSAKQSRSMKDMQKIQPELKKIQEKYKDDKQKQSEAMTKLYQEHGVNPVAGCLPMVLTLIIIFPLYRAIFQLVGTGADDAVRTVHAVAEDPALRFLWIKHIQNIAYLDGVINWGVALLVILNGVATFGQTYVMQKLSENNSQSNLMMWIMPLFILGIGFTLPAGVLIYWFTQTALMGIQQYIIQKEPDTKEVAKE